MCYVKKNTGNSKLVSSYGSQTWVCKINSYLKNLVIFVLPHYSHDFTFVMMNVGLYPTLANTENLRHPVETQHGCEAE